LTSLGLFEILTLSTKATSTACSVNAASLNVGMAATIAGSLQTTTGIAVITSLSAIAAGITFRDVVMSIAIIAVIFGGFIIVGLYFSLD
jgi:hypothetical protein